MKALRLHAGPAARRHIAQNGLQPQDIGVVPGAAGTVGVLSFQNGLTLDGTTTNVIDLGGDPTNTNTHDLVNVGGVLAAADYRFDDPVLAARLRPEIANLIENDRGGGDPANVVLTSCDFDPALVGKNLAQLLRERQQAVTFAAAGAASSSSASSGSSKSSSGGLPSWIRLQRCCR